MNKHILPFFIILMISSFSRAQNTGITGQITDKSDLPLTGAVIVLMQPKDSVIVKGVTSDVKGNFSLQDFKPGRYLLKISLMGYADLFLFRKIGNQPVSLGKLVLNERAEMLNEVNIEGKTPPSQLKGDTTQYNANAFKTNPDANAQDLVAKMPGVTVQNEKVQAQGEDVKQVTVDGKNFFGDDPNTVLKNLPADIIDKIQVFDQKSDQSQFTGFDDGNTSKTMNIVTRSQFKNSIFGKVFGGYGYDNKWKGGFNINFVKGNRRLSFLGNTNNINDQNFSSEDLLGVMGNSGRSSRMPGGSGFSPGRSSSRDRGGPPSGGGGDAGNFLVDQKNGITTTQSFGVNYVDKWKDVDFTGSYFFNYTQNKAENDIFRQYITSPNQGLTYSETNTGKNNNMNHRVNFRFNWKIDSMNSILFTPRFSLQLNNSSTFMSGENKLQDTASLSNTANATSSDLLGINFSAPILFRHSFFKKRRTFSWNITPGYNNSNGNSKLNSLSRYYSDTLPYADSLNQQADRYTRGYNLNSSINYTEPIGNASQLLFSIGDNYSNSYSDKETYNYSFTSDAFDIFDTTLSNKFKTQYFSQSAGASYRYQKDKVSFTLGVSYQYANLKSQQEFPYEYDLDKDFQNVLPNAMFQYKFSQKTSLRMNYRSSNNVPSVSQMQNVINNANPLQLSSGNPDLKQDWQNSLFLRFTSLNPTNNTSFFMMLAGTYTNNYIANSTYIASKDSLLVPGILLSNGSQLTRPVNLDNYINLRAFSNFSFVLKPIKTNVNFFLGGTFSHTPGLINGANNFANNAGANFGISLSSNISDKVDFNISSFSAYNNISNTLQTSQNSNYFNQNSRFKIQVMPWKGLVLQTDLNHQYNTGLSQNYNQNYLLWNAAIGYKFLKNNAAEFRLSAYDLLKQNNSISRNTTESYIEDTQTNVLQRYFMLTFTYNIKYFKTSKPNTKS